MTEELYAFDAEYRARAGVVCGVTVQRLPFIFPMI